MQFPGLFGARFDPGSVWLVGAGPGDPGLLTLHAAYALGQADVVVHDALVSDAILSLAPEAVLELAGKRAGGVRTQQLRINDRLIRLARRGLRVVRLKGGDPLVFGRGGEEALALAAAGIGFRIVPGISAGLGATAAAGIPLTHRGLARSVALATGHDSSGELADVDWASVSRGSEVLVFYMAQRRIGQIAERLMQAGRDAGEPVALISNATRVDQEVRISTLAEAGSAAVGIASGAATLIVVGPTIGLRALLADWQQIEPMTVAGGEAGSQGRLPLGRRGLAQG
ncbi:uroporphyrinogen-III C-methyltransferase [Rhodopila sp.]|uniref:uroporphyrinogen-III C-methyltransferase n=1 Tax=Rhodopila sp. TaxID=2480087 RepID=UPI003D0FDB2E